VLKTYRLHSAMDQSAAERNAQELCIRYVSGLRNQKLFCPNKFRVPRQPSELTVRPYGARAPGAPYRLADRRFKCERPQLHIIWTTGPNVLPYEESE